MPGIDETRAYLRIFGDDLDPDALTAALRADPSYAFRKGDLYRQRIATTGRWVIHAKPSKPGNLDRQVAELLERMTNDVIVWQSITSRYGALFYCSAFMAQTNEGTEFAPTTLAALGARGISLGLDIYAPRDNTE